jgi:hypothetical protein
MTGQEWLDDAKHQVEEASERLGAWPDRHEEMAHLFPKQGLCALCYLAGKTEQPKHDLIWLCPHPSALFVPYAWSNGRLRAGSRYMADKSTFVDLLRAIGERYAGENPAATVRWMRLHRAAQDLLDACEATEALLTGLTGNEEEVLNQLRDAIEKALAGEQPSQEG